MSKRDIFLTLLEMRCGEGRRTDTKCPFEFARKIRGLLVTEFKGHRFD
jgi:hypothetical protein